MFQSALVPGNGDSLDQRIHQQIEAVISDLLRSGQWAAYHHPLIEQLRETMLAQLGVTQVRFCPSGSAAIELALRVCNLKPQDEVICSALDYPGNVRAIRVLDLLPVIVDVAPEHFTIDLQSLVAASTPQTRAVLVSHLYGQIAPVDKLRQLCDDRNWLLIEDVCQMPGAVLGKQMLGALGHVGTFSFGGNKPVTCGAGGAIVTSDRRIAARMDQYIDRPSDSLTISPLQAAVLLPQWHWIAELTARHRQQLAAWLAQNGQEIQCPITVQQLSDSQQSPVVYKLPVRRISDDDNLGSVPQWPLGEVFRPQIKSLPGRGRVGEIKHATWMHQQYGLLDTRALLHPSQAPFVK